MSWKKDVLINNCFESCQEKFSVKILGKYLWRSLFLVKFCQPATLLKMNFFKDFDCKFQSTYFPEHLLSGCFCRGEFRTLSRWRFLVNIMNGLKPWTIFTKKLHLPCFTRFCVRLCSEVTSSIYLTHKFKVYCNYFEDIAMYLMSLFHAHRKLYPHWAMNVI